MCERDNRGEAGVGWAFRCLPLYTRKTSHTHLGGKVYKAINGNNRKRHVLVRHAMIGVQVGTQLCHRHRHPTTRRYNTHTKTAHLHIHNRTPRQATSTTASAVCLDKPWSCTPHKSNFKKTTKNTTTQRTVQC